MHTSNNGLTLEKHSVGMDSSLLLMQKRLLKGQNLHVSSCTEPNSAVANVQQTEAKIGGWVLANNIL